MLTSLILWPIHLQTYFLSPTKKKFKFSKIIRIFTNFVMCLNKLLEEKFKEKVPEKRENAYLTLTNARASRALMQGTDFANASSAHFRYWLPLRMRARV